MRNLSEFNPSVEAFIQYVGFCMAVWGSLFNNRDGEAEDIIEANEGMLEMVSDSDAVGVIQDITGENLRDQLTVQKVLDFHEEAQLLKMKGRRN